MSNPSNAHRPLLAGLRIEAGRDTGGSVHQINYGTLTGVARQTDGTLVLVTCFHVMAGGLRATPQGDELMFQGGLDGAHRVGGRMRWVQPNLTPDIYNLIDGATVELSNREAISLLHNTPVHTQRRVVRDTVPPEKNMELLMMGGISGERTVSVLHKDVYYRLEGVGFAGMIVLDMEDTPLQPGDSGAPLLSEDENGDYHMVGVVVGKGPGDSFGFALPASIYESAFGIKFGNTPPVANAGGDKTAYRGQSVELNGSGSDLDGDTLTYQWEQLGLDELGISAVTPVTINMADQATANFVAPNEIGALSFQLTVTDSHEASYSDEVQVTVQNRNPIAYAGPDKLITVNNRVTLEGSVSDIDPDDRASVTHTWTQDDENPATVTLSPVAAWPARRTFTPRVDGTYVFTLTATDPYGLEDSDEVRVRVVKTPPTAVPGWNQAVPVNSPVTLLGAAEDPDAGHVGDMRYSWRVDSAPGSSARSATTGPTITLSDPNVADPTFTPTAIGDYVFTLTVTDPDGLSDEANVTIHCCSDMGASEWYDTGEPGCHNNAFQKRQTQVKDGITEFQWVLNTPRQRRLQPGSSRRLPRNPEWHCQRP